MRRSLLTILLILVIGFAAYLWLNGTGRSTWADRTEDRPLGTSGIDVSKARERGGEVGEKAARVARLIFYIAHDIATDPTLPTYTEEGWRQVEAILQGAGS